MFGDPEEECFSALPAPLSPSPYRQLPQQREKPRVRPSPYSGSTSWEDYKAQFELVADLNQWDRRTKAAYLAVSLSDQAVLGDLDKTQRTSYTDLVAALGSRFGTSNRTEMFQVSLRSRTCKPEETLPELVQAIRHLTRQAYPDATVSLWESIAKDQFIEALTDPRWKVHQVKAVTLTEALDAAVEVEAFFSAEKQRSSKTKILQAVTSQSPGPTDATLRQEVHELKAMVQRLAQHPQGTPDTLPHGWQRTWTSPECWLCGAQGHIQCYCPKCFVHRQVGPFSHLRNVRETRHCRVQGPEPDRPLNTKAHLPFSQNRCCEPLQRWSVCQWNREWYTGSVFSGYKGKHHHNSDPSVGGYVSQSSVNTKPTRTCLGHHEIGRWTHPS